MRKSIAQFMWGFQPHFRSGLERVARDVFEQIGFGLGARAFLVGFTDDANKVFPICFEPEHDPLAAVDLSSVVADAQRRYEESDESQMVYGSRRHHERIHRGYLDSFRAEAVRHALTNSPEGSGLTFFVGSSVLVDGTYEVHAVVAVPTARWDSKPALSRVRVDRYTVVPSFQQSLMDEVLRAATVDLSRSAPPEDFSLRWSDRSELIRKAARAFVQSVSVFSGYEFPSELAVALDEISAQPYEGRSGSGGLLLASKANPHVEMVLEFVEPTRVSETRAMRKALEMADPRHHLLCDGEKVVGLARLRDTYDPADENVFAFNVMSRGVWSWFTTKCRCSALQTRGRHCPSPRWISVTSSPWFLGCSTRSAKVMRMSYGASLRRHLRRRTAPCLLSTGMPATKLPVLSRRRSRYGRNFWIQKCWQQ